MSFKNIEVFISAHFLWADAVFGKAGELTAVSSPLVKTEQDVCFNFWFDVRVEL